MNKRSTVKSQHEQYIIDQFIDWWAAKKNEQFRILSRPEPPDAIIESTQRTTWLEVSDAFFSDELARELYSAATPGEACITMKEGVHYNMDKKMAERFAEGLKKKLSKQSYADTCKKYGPGLLLMNTQSPWFDEGTVVMMREACRDVDWTSDRGHFADVFIGYRSMNRLAFEEWVWNERKMWLQETHLLRLTNPTAWAEKADELIEVADHILPKADAYWSSKDGARASLEHFLSSYMMLISFALENILKGILVDENREEMLAELRRRRVLPDLLDTHNLLKLCAAADVATVPEEDGKCLFEQLTRCAEWYARYPMPRKPSQIPAENIFGLKKTFIAMSSYRSHDIADIRKTVDCLRERLSIKISHRNKRQP